MSVRVNPSTKQKAFRREVFEYTKVLVYCVCIAFLVFTFLFRTATVDGRSMEPTLEDGDRLVISRMFYKPKRGDIIVITQPNEDNQPYIKRIIATGGDSVDIDFDRGLVFVNGKLLEEPYIKEATLTRYDVQFPVIVPEGCVFAMGDNRNHSKDSRDSALGMVDERYILGRCLLRFFPFGKIGVVS